MKIINKKEVIADKVKLADNILSKAYGLMFSKRLKKGEALLFISDEESILKTALHMFFVFFPIDIIWLDSSNKIVDIKFNVKPFTPLIKPRKPAKYVLELPVNTAKNLKIGNVLKFSKDI